MIKAGHFAFYRGLPVGITSIIDGFATIRYKTRVRIVSVSELSPFTIETAMKTLKKYQGRINRVSKKYNLRMHEINECLRYYEGP